MAGAVRLTTAAALALALAACNQGDSGNVMAPEANALTPAQVDLALGPEVTNAAGNALDQASEADAIAQENAVEAADEEDALDESVVDEPAPANNGSDSEADTAE